MDHQPFVYVWLDATYLHVRESGQVVSKVVVIATGLRAAGHREVHRGGVAGWLEHVPNLDECAAEAAWVAVAAWGSAGEQPADGSPGVGPASLVEEPDDELVEGLGEDDEVVAEADAGPTEPIASGDAFISPTDL